MRHGTVCLVLALALAGCSAPRKSAPSPAADLTGMEKEIAATRDAIHQLEARLGHLETQIAAASAEGELTVMTIDTVEGAASKAPAFGLEAGSKALLCHVVEWRGFGKMKRFTQLADHQFSLEAHGHPAVLAHMAEGGINNSDGSIRYVMLYPSSALEPGVQYQVRPRNENDKYKWSVAHGLTITGS